MSRVELAAGERLPAAVLGATGYVAGELLRLLAGHPRLALAAAVSRSRAGEPVAGVFPHLRGVYPDTAAPGADAGPVLFAGEAALDALTAGGSPLAVFSCLPHGHAAAKLDALLARCEAHGTPVRLVDISADFRLPTVDDYRRVYGGEHGAPERYGDFFCGVPELSAENPAGHVAHPGCFTTAVTLACAAAQALDLAEPDFRVSAVTGSTGSGRTPSAGTHHPDRHGSFRAYKPLTHRHTAEMEMFLARLGPPPTVRFAPHSGPFARGIYATVHLDLKSPLTTAELAGRYAGFYAGAPFVSVGTEPPHLKEVVATNRCRIGVAADGDRAVVFSAIDNLTKGAAGGALQWMNRLQGWDETLGLDLPGVGWN